MRSRLLDPGYARDLLVASDPDLDRLRTGLRAVVTVMLASWALSGLPAPLDAGPVWLIPVEVGMLSALAVADADPGARRRTLLLLPVAALAAAAVATFALAARWLTGVAAVAVIAASVAARRFGPRGQGLGVAGFLTFLLGVYFHLRPRQLPPLAGQLALATAITYAVRFWLVPDRPARAARRTVHAFRRAVSVVLREGADLVVGRTARHRAARLLRRGTERLQTAALVVEDACERLEVDEAPPPLPELRTRVFELELAGDRVVRAVGQLVASGALPAPAREEVRAALLAAGAHLRGARGARDAARAALSRAREAAGGARASPAAEADLRRLGSALGDLLAGAAELPTPPLGRLAPGRADARPPPDEVRRQTLQASAAGALAVVAGSWISPSRWFWAVIASFVVFIRAPTRGDTLLRAWLRILGTLGGALAGFGLAELLAGHRRLQLAACFACVFLAYWLFRASYAWLIFWFTALLAILYRMLHLLTPALLLLRMEETLAGALIGALIAAVLLPVRTSQRMRAGVASLLRALAALLEALPRTPAGSEEALLERARALDVELQAVRATARPLTGRVSFTPRAAGVVHAAASAVLFARHLAPPFALARLDADARGRVCAAGARLAGNARALADAVEGGGGARVEPAADLIAEVRGSLRGEAAVPSGPRSPPVWLRWLEEVDGALSELADRLQALPGRPAAAARGG